MKQFGTRALIVVGLAISTLLTSQSVAYASDPRVSGGGVVDGDLGTTSQLGFTASSSGGEFLCVMAGRSGGFPFGPWASIAQMHVQGNVTAGSLSMAADGSATFSGTATIHVVGKTSSGDVLTATLTGIAYTSWQTAGGAGVAQHKLNVAVPGGTFGPAFLRSGHITIKQ
ncbi:MAG TPA: hypothetical protein VGR46_10830 [Candidatus Limnocylindria bacterium]|jgi:hypothetical protein|nr:hypothetical protein [Candidatus Limnocylindria bacterium]